MEMLRKQNFTKYGFLSFNEDNVLSYFVISPLGNDCNWTAGDLDPSLWKWLIASCCVRENLYGLNSFLSAHY